MGMAGLAGAVLGPSPLLLPLAPLVAIVYVLFMLATAALRTPMGLGLPCTHYSFWTIPAPSRRFSASR